MENINAEYQKKLMERKKEFNLRIINEKYGTMMAQICEANFPDLLNNGHLGKVLINNFYPHEFLAEDLVKQGGIDNFVNFIYSKFNTNQNEYQSIEPMFF